MRFLTKAGEEEEGIEWKRAFQEAITQVQKRGEKTKAAAAADFS